MPKKVTAKKARMATDKPFVPGYYCPICLELIDQPVKATRPLVFHPEHKPHHAHPDSRKRICPGCGAQRDRGPGNGSSYCGPDCKTKYQLYMQNPKNNTKRKEWQCSMPGCDKAMSHNGKKLRVCKEHLDRIQDHTSFLDADGNKPWSDIGEAYDLVRQECLGTPAPAPRAPKVT